MQNPDIGPITDFTGNYKFFDGDRDDNIPFILENLKRPSNQVLQKNPDDSLEGVRYVIATEPSTLRPIKSWTILIEKWECRTMADITAHDVLFMRVKNTANDQSYDYGDLIRDIVIDGEKQSVDNHSAFNAIMAAGVLINRIDAGRLPDTDKILRTYNFTH